MTDRCAVTEDENRYQAKLCKEDAKEQSVEALVDEIEEYSRVDFEDSEGESQEVTIFDCVQNAIENDRLETLVVELFEAKPDDRMAKVVAIREQLLADAKFLIESQLD